MVSSKRKAFYVERSDGAFVIARTSGYTRPMQVEQIREVPDGKQDSVPGILDSMEGRSGGSGYQRARCGVYPPRRLVGCMTVDEPRKAREPNYLERAVTSNFDVDTNQYRLAVLHPRTGAPVDVGNLMEKEFLLCGALIQELASEQESLLESAIYPDRLELGSVATLGALADYHRFAGLEHPTVVLELEMEELRLYIVSGGGVERVQRIPYGLGAMVGVVRRELGLKDDGAAQRLFYSDSFDFKEMGPRLIDRHMREVNSLIGAYEVQTGQSVGQVFCSRVPGKLTWLNRAFAKSLNVDPLVIDFIGWLKEHEVGLPADLDSNSIPGAWIGLFGLMIDPKPSENEKQ